MRAASIPDGRYASPEEVANVMLWLASDMSGHVVGQGVHVNGASMRSDGAPLTDASVAVIGGGAMGEGIVYVFAMAGFETHLVEPVAARRAAVARALVEVAGDAVARGRANREETEARIASVRMVADVADLPARAAAGSSTGRAPLPVR